MSPSLRIVEETWPIAGRFAISRGAKSEAHVIVAELLDGAHVGRGECVPYGRYGETPAGVRATLSSCAPDLAQGLSREGLQKRLPAGAARNALDCAFWDLEAKRRRMPVAALAGLASPEPRVTAFTLSLDRPDAMGRAAAKERERPLLKLKLGGDGSDFQRVASVAAAAPSARLILDANEAWADAQLDAMATSLAHYNIALIEQPLPAGADAGLTRGGHALPICADESLHDRTQLADIARRYDFINIKLDKTGGLTEAIALAGEAKALGLGILVGCMVGTSLAMAPAFMLASGADYIDLDGPLLLARDRARPIRYDASLMYPPDPALWG